MTAQSIRQQEFKQAARELLATSASASLLTRIEQMLDASPNPAALQETCEKVEKMVALFVARDKSQSIKAKFAVLLSRVQ
jgi:hypothetical protein